MQSVCFSPFWNISCLVGIHGAVHCLQYSKDALEENLLNSPDLLVKLKLIFYITSQYVLFQLGLYDFSFVSLAELFVWCSILALPRSAELYFGGAKYILNCLGLGSV